MEENLQNSSDMPMGDNVSSTVEVSQSETAPPMTTGETTSTAVMPYATFLQRLVAFLIDAVIVGFSVGLLGTLLSPVFGGGDNSPANLLGSIIGPAYAIFMLVKYGATLGKMAMGIKVQNEVTGELLTPVEAFLREVVGKFLSGIALLLGYFWMLWDDKKQTWHDKIAKSIVVKTK